MKKLEGIDLSRVDWGQSNRAIGRQLGVAGQTVKRLREERGELPSQHKGGYPDQSHSKPRGKVHEINVSELDFGMSDRSLGRQLGVANQTVARLRKLHGIPPSQHGGPSRNSPRRRIDPKWLEVDWSLPLAEIARRLNVSRQRAHQVKKKLDKNGNSKDQSDEADTA